MMTYPEYVEAKEYRERLLKLVEAGRKALPPQGSTQFADSILSKVRLIESDIVSFEKSSTASMCAWLGLRTFNVTAQLAARTAETEFNVLWNTPVRIVTTIPATIEASQGSLLPEGDDELFLHPEPLPA
jgi:hypothetical protein